MFHQTIKNFKLTDWSYLLVDKVEEWLTLLRERWKAKGLMSTEWKLKVLALGWEFFLKEKIKGKGIEKKDFYFNLGMLSEMPRSPQGLLDTKCQSPSKRPGVVDDVKISPNPYRHQKIIVLKSSILSLRWYISDSIWIV